VQLVQVEYFVQLICLNYMNMAYRYIVMKLYIVVVTTHTVCIVFANAFNI